MGERFSISQLKDEVSVYDEFVVIPWVSQGSEYDIKLFPLFKPEKVRDLINELIEFFKAAEKEKVSIPPVEEDDLVGYFMAKYFTDIKFTKSKKAKAIYDEFKIALNSQLFEVIMKTFPKESQELVFKRIYEAINANIQLQSKFKEAQELIKNLPLENKEVFEQLNITQK